VPDRGKLARHRFGADRRIAGRSGFAQLLRSGKRRSLSGYTFYMARRAAGPARLGIMVTRRHAALATERNRIKRCIREAFRQEQDGLGALDVLIRPPYGARASAAMQRQLRALLARLEQ
jgi:ribonuclease P protein component